jgi:hypothetical protein
MSDIIKNMAEDIKNSNDLELNYELSSHCSNNSNGFPDLVPDVNYLTAAAQTSARRSARKKNRSKSAYHKNTHALQSSSLDRPKTTDSQLQHQNQTQQQHYSHTHADSHTREGHIYTKTQAQSLSAHRNGQRSLSGSVASSLRSREKDKEKSWSSPSHRHSASSTHDEADVHSLASSHLTLNSSFSKSIPTTRAPSPAPIPVPPIFSSLPRQVANNIESEFGIPIDKRAGQSKGGSFLPTAATSQRSLQRSQSAAAQFNVTTSSIFSKSTTPSHTEGSPSIAMRNNSAETDPYLTLDMKYVGVAQSLSAYGLHARSGSSSSRAASASKGAGGPVMGTRKIQLLDFTS